LRLLPAQSTIRSKTKSTQGNAWVLFVLLRT
jgi:hypothetical protein